MEKKERPVVTIHNKISGSFKQIHVDGAYGGITPRGLLNLNFFAERTPIPKSTDFSITETGIIGEKIKDSEDSKDGILREYEFGVYMDIEVAKSILVLLSTRVQELETIIKQAKSAINSK